MEKLPGFIIHSTIAQSTHTIIYRGERKNDRKPVIIKILKEKYPSLERLSKFKLEYEIGTSLDIKGVIRPYEIKSYLNSLAIIMEDIGGDSVTTLLQKHKKFKLSLFLKIASKVAKILGDIHKNDIIHMDIKPDNIIINQETDEVKIIDFGISTRFMRDKMDISKRYLRGGTYYYIAPEQTGLVNMHVDHRVDLYSLGITFYQMITGTLPFMSKNKSALVNMHITKLPEPPHSVDSSVPRVVSDIIMKLMEKNYEDRYKSAYGLYKDLEHCKKLLHGEKITDSFDIAAEDSYDRLYLSHKIYGRDREIQVLLNTLSVIATGKKRVVTVHGPAGAGKSSLVHEIYHKIPQQNAYFIEGKFEKINRDIPYSAIIQVFNNLIDMLLMETDEENEKFVARFNEAIGENGDILVRLFPKLKILIGEQPHQEMLAPEENQERFKDVFNQFVRLFARKEHPLVIFLDDLQNADISSSHLLKTNFFADDIFYFMVIIAYRSNELDKFHPFNDILHELRKKPDTLLEIELKPLNLENITQMIADSIDCDYDLIIPLAEAVALKTGGNPFFVNKFITYIYDKHYLDFDFDTGWFWDLNKIKRQSVTSNVIDLLNQRLRELPSDTQHILSLAACVGNTFDLKRLSILTQLPEKIIGLKLWNARQQGLIIPFNMVEQFETGDNIENVDLFALENIEVSYQFVHDRVRQAAYSLVQNDEEQRRNHYKIGYMMITYLSSKESRVFHKKIFEVVKHLNLSKDLISQSFEKYELVNFNLEAGKSARQALAYSSARNYFKTGLELLDDTCWDNHYNITFELYHDLTEIEFLLKNYEEAEALFDVLLKHTRLKLDEVKVLLLQIKYYSIRIRMDVAFKIGKEASSMLHLNLIDTTHIEIFTHELEAIHRYIKKRIHSSKEKMNINDFPEKKLAMDVLISVCLPAYVSAPSTFPSIILKIIYQLVNYQPTPVTAFAYAFYGQILSCVTRDMTEANNMAELSLKLIDQFDSEIIRGRIYFIYSTIIHWIKPLGECLEYLQKAIDVCIRYHEIQYSGLIYISYCYTLFITGDNLNNCLEQYQEFEKRINKLTQPLYEKIFRINKKLIEALLNGKEDTANDYFFINREEVLELHNPENIRVYGYNYLASIIFNFYSGEYLKCVEICREENIIREGLFGTTLTASYYFYYLLALSECFSEINQELILVYREKAYAIKEYFKQNYKYNHATYHNKYLLIQAECRRITGNNKKKAEAELKKAVELARENGFIHEESIAYERLATWYLRNNDDKNAAKYMEEAYYCYLKWGVKVKIQHIERHYPDLIKDVSFEIKN